MFQSNQQTLKADIEEYVQDDKLRAKMNSVSKTEKRDGWIETRSAFTTNDASWMPGDRQWPGLKCIGAIKTHFEYKGKVTEEWHYYISSKELTAADLLHMREWNGALKPCIGCLMYATGKIISEHKRYINNYIVIWRLPSLRSGALRPLFRCRSRFRIWTSRPYSKSYK